MNGEIGPLRQSSGSVLSSSEKRTEELVDRLILDIKALELLHGSEADLKSRLDRELVGSHDESVIRFVKALQTGEKPHSRGLFLMALGELVLASLLVLAATIVLVPSLIGVSSASALLKYVIDNTIAGLWESPLGQYVTLIDFALGALLMLAAFYTLRQAALNLKETGLSIKPGD
jgi:hypothetical protein